MPLLRMCVPAVGVIGAAVRDFYFHVWEEEEEEEEEAGAAEGARFISRAIIFGLGPTFLVLLWFSKKEAHAVMLYRAMTVLVPAARIYFGAWPPTSDMCFRLGLTNIIFIAAYLSVFTGPSFSAFARHASAEHFYLAS